MCRNLTGDGVKISEDTVCLIRIGGGSHNKLKLFENLLTTTTLKLTKELKRTEEQNT